MSSPMVAALYGLGFGVGLWLVIDGLTRRPRPHRGATAGVLRRWAAGSGPVLLAGAVAAAAVVGVWTRWPVAALLAAVGVWAAPGLLAGARTSGRTQARLEAVAGWAESLRGTLQAAAGLEQAILATAVTAPQPIRQEVTRLAGAIRAGVRLPVALRAFADDLDHPDGDHNAVAPGRRHTTHCDLRHAEQRPICGRSGWRPGTASRRGAPITRPETSA